MIRNIEVSNYRSLGPDTKIRLGGLTVFVGQNGVGKSNIIDLFRFISDAMKMGIDGAVTKRGGIASIRRWSDEQPLDISFKIEIADLDEDYSAVYQFAIGGHSKHEYSVQEERALVREKGKEDIIYHISNGKWISQISGVSPQLSPLTLVLPIISGDKRFSKLENVLRNMNIYNIFPETLRQPQKYDPQRPMDEHGSNWASILKDQDSGDWKDELVKALKKLTGDIDDIEIVQLASFLIARFRHGEMGESKKAKWFDATQESDGTLRMAGIITALLQQPELPLIGIEEPEMTIHPGAIPIVYDFLASASRKSQVIVTTHSPELLDAIEDVDQIRVVTKDAECTRIGSIKEDQLEAVKSGLLSAGEIHRGEGLKGSQMKLF